MGRTARRVVEIVLLGTIVVLFLKAFDVGSFHELALKISPGAVLGLIGFQTALLGLGALGWGLLLKEAGIYRGPWRTFLSRVGGFSITYLTPSMSFGGVPARASLYGDPSMGGERLYTTIALDSFIEIAGKIPCIVAGFILLLLLPRAGVPFVLAGGAALLVLLGGCLFILVKLLSGRAFIVRFLKPPLRRLAGISPRLACRILAGARSYAKSIAIIAGRKRILAITLLVSFAVSLLEVAQAFFILRILGFPSVAHSFIIYSSVLVHGVIGVLPGNLGGMEGTQMLVFTLLGLDPSMGILYSILLRTGQMTMVLAGILVIVVKRIAKWLRMPSSGSRTVRTVFRSLRP